jgi:hypothetical protein
MNNQVIASIVANAGNKKLVQLIEESTENYKAVDKYFNWKQWNKITDKVDAPKHDCIWAMINHIKGDDDEVAGL